MLTVRIPDARAIWITERPTPELAAFCTSQSPGRSVAKFRSMQKAVAGLMRSIAACCAGTASGTPTKSATRATPKARHAPNPGGSNTRRPRKRALTPASASASSPKAITRPTPSWPGTQGSAGN